MYYIDSFKPLNFIIYVKLNLFHENMYENGC